MAASQGTTARISSGATRFYKRSFPILWFGVVLVVLAIGFTVGYTKGIALRVMPVFFILPCVFTLVGLLMRRLFRDLVDEVYDAHDHLTVVNNGEQIQVPLTNIMNVSASTLTNPPRVTLRLVNPGRFGDEVSFIPVRTSILNPLARNKIIDDLIVRVDRARARRVF
jgi:hypothetical protein